MEMAEEVKYLNISSEYIEAFSFEVFDVVNAVETVRKLRPLFYLIVATYLVGIYFGRKWMKNRRAFDLKIPLFIWNMSLAVFSLLCTLRIAPEFLYLLSQPDGTYLVMCTREIHNYATFFWLVCFAISKIIELGDTVFIILRKQPLIFLHWFHHLGTLTICWVGFEQVDSRARMFVMNAFVHVFMYSYYALRVLGIKIPAKISKALTMFQIFQLACFIYLALSSVIYEAQGHVCKISAQVTYVGLVNVSIFFILFVNFFIQRYLGKRNKTPSKIK